MSAAHTTHAWSALFTPTTHVPARNWRAFEQPDYVFRPNTELDGATLDIREVDGHARCLACGAEFATTTLYEPCACGSRRLLLMKGEELKIKTMELEEVD
jgi:Zn finger protein HypA/HybF involved in hydrogenase expression